MTARVGDVDPDAGDAVDGQLEPDGDGALFGAEAAGHPEPGGEAAVSRQTPCQALVAAYADTVRANGGTLVDDHAKAVGRNVKRILDGPTKVPMPVLLRAVQQAAASGRRDIGTVLAAPNGPGAKYASSGAQRAAMDEAWAKVAPDMDAWVQATMARSGR